MNPSPSTHHQATRAQVEAPLRWLILATVHFDHAFWLAVGLAVATFFVRSPTPVLVAGLVVLGLLGLVELATAFAIGRLSGPRIVPVNAFFIRHPPPPFFRWLRDQLPNLGSAVLVGLTLAALVSSGGSLYAANHYGALAFHLLVGALAFLWFGVAFAGFAITCSVQEKFVAVVPRQVVIDRIRHAQERVYFFGNPALLAEPPPDIDARGVFDAGPSSLVAARFIQAETSPKFVIVDGATYHFYQPDQPLFAQLRDSDLFTRAFLYEWQPGDTQPYQQDSHVSL